jgi:thiol-disulfide isomerase/thioredoxin
MKYLLIVIFLSFNSSLKASIIEIQSWVNPVSEPEIKKDQFIMIDFWATWCGPCLRAMDHLSELKKVTGDKVVYVSLTKEPEELVRHFFTKREAKTYIAIDYLERTFGKFNIESLPHSVLIAPDGQIIWQGNPSEMSFNRIKELTKSTSYSTTSVNTKIKTFMPAKVKSNMPNAQLYESEGVSLSFTPAKEVISFNKSTSSVGIEISGSIQEILATVYNMSLHDIVCEDGIRAYGYLTLNKPVDDYNLPKLMNILHKIFNISTTMDTVSRQNYILTVVDSTMLWNPAIYEWNQDQTPSFMTWDNNFQGDNYSLKEIAHMLSNHMGLNIKYLGIYDQKHDWNLNIENVDSLATQLKNEYGIAVVPEIRTDEILYVKRGL